MPHPKATPNASKSNMVVLDNFCDGFALGMSISCCLSSFCSRWVANVKTVSGGIWALSLYSTATQNTWRRGLALGYAPDARILRWRYQHVGILEPTQSFKFALPPTPNPDASQWNIGCVGSLALGLCVGHVHFIFFVLISFALGSRRKRSFQWNMGLRHTHDILETM